MARRKSKKPQEGDTSMLLESPTSVSQSKKRIKPYASPALLFIIIFAVGASIMGWFCVQQQQSLDELSESFVTMQRTITNLQQVMDTTDVTLQTDFGVEERIFALEEAQKQVQEKAEVALDISEKFKNTDQLWALRDEMDIRLTEIKQVALSVTSLQAMFKNQSEELEAMKESVVAGLSSSLALAENVAGLTNAMARVDERFASVEALHAQLKGQASELDELKESMDLHNVALHTNNQKMAAIKEFIEAKEAMHAQEVEEMLSSVQMTLDEQFSTSQTVRDNIMAQLQNFHTQLAKAPAWTKKLKSNEEAPASEELISATAQKASEVKQEDVEEEDEQLDAGDEAAEEEEEEEEVEEEEEEEEEEEAMQELEVEGDVTEEQEEEENTEEEEDEEITEQSEEQEEENTEEEEDEEITEQNEEQEEEEYTEEEEFTEEEEDEELTEESEEEEQEEEEYTEEEEDDEEMTEQSEENEVPWEKTDDKVVEETVDSHILDESLEEEEDEDEEEEEEEDESEDVEESWETEEEESAELDGEDKNEEDG